MTKKADRGLGYLLITCGLAAALALVARPATAAPAKPFQPDGVPAGQLTLATPGPNAKSEYFLTIFGGSTLGVYYYVASAICKAVNARFEEHRIHCAPLRSQGAGSNRELMRNGRAQMAIVQTDINYVAATGSAPMPGARSVVSLHNEVGLLVVSPQSGITHPLDLRNQRVNLASPKSGANGLWNEYLAGLNLDYKDFKEARQFAQDLSFEGLCTNVIDAFGVWSGHPSRALQQTMQQCQAQLVGMWDPKLQSWLNCYPYYFRAELPANVYKGQPKALESYAIKASLIAHEQTLPHIVYWVTRVLMEDVDGLSRLHPTLAHLNGREMAGLGNFLPFHEGAQKYWTESGLLAIQGVPAVKAGSSCPAL